MKSGHPFSLTRCAAAALVLLTSAQSFATGEYGSGSSFDLFPPTCVVVSPLNGATRTHAGFSVKGTAKDSGSGVKKVGVAIADKDFFVATGTATWRYRTPAFPAAKAKARLTSVALDEAGNKSAFVVISVKLVN